MSNDDKARLMQEMSEQLEQALDVLHFDEAISIIENHISKMIEESARLAAGQAFADRLDMLRRAIRQYREERLAETVPGYSVLRDK